MRPHLAALAGILALQPLAIAQLGTTTIHGRVIDNKGQIVKGAMVSSLPSPMHSYIGQMPFARTDEHGEFTLSVSTPASAPGKVRLYAYPDNLHGPFTSACPFEDQDQYHPEIPVQAGVPIQSVTVKIPPPCSTLDGADLQHVNTLDWKLMGATRQSDMVYGGRPMRFNSSL